MTKPSLTIVIPTLNEAQQIAECVRSVAWADEVIVADGGSTDGTTDQAARAGARVLNGTRWATIASQRNAAITVARNQWIFALDADERVSPALAREIVDTVAAPAHPAYHVRRRNVYLGRPISRAGWGRDWVVRLFRNDQRYIERRVHEGLQHQVDAGRLVEPLDHAPYRDLGHHVEKVNRYAVWAAQDLADRGRRAGVADLLLRPPLRFLRMYLLQLGVLEGWRGAVLCGLAAMGVFLKYARLRELQRDHHV